MHWASLFRMLRHKAQQSGTCNQIKCVLFTPVSFVTDRIFADICRRICCDHTRQISTLCNDYLPIQRQHTQSHTLDHLRKLCEVDIKIVRKLTHAHTKRHRYADTYTHREGDRQTHTNDTQRETESQDQKQSERQTKRLGQRHRERERERFNLQLHPRTPTRTTR